MKTTIALRSRCVWIATLLVALVLAPAASAQSAPTLSKAFNPTTIGPGSTAALQLTIANPSATAIRNLSFSDSLPAGLTIAVPSSATTDCFNATLSAPAGGTTITLSSDGIGAGSSCTVTVNVTASAVGSYLNTTSTLASDNGTSPAASATLTVAGNRPGFSKSFSPSSIFFGERSRLTFTIDNGANASNALNLTFSDPLPAGIIVADPANAASTCNGGLITAVAGSSSISYVPFLFGDANVAAGATCTVAVDVVGNGVGANANVSGELTSVVTGPSLTSGFATAELDVQTLRLSIEKSFTDDPVAPGGTVNLRFTIRNLDRSSSASNIGFSDDLGAALAGLAAVSLPSNPCGAGSTLTGSGVITLAGGSLAAEGVCTFDVGLVVPAGAASGSYPNVSGAVSATVDGETVVGNAASDDLFVVIAPELAKSFVDDPVGAGGTVTLEFTLVNPSASGAMTAIGFTDSFSSVTTTAAATPGSGFCGAGSTSSFTPATSFQPAMLTVSNASLDPGGSCTFSLTLNVVQDAPTGTYPNLTSAVSATFEGESVTGAAAGDDLVVVGGALLRKEFIADPVTAGDTVVLRFTLFLDEGSPGDATGITFTDDLSATLAGLVAGGLPATDVCGTGSEIAGTGTLSFTGGSLAPGDQCTFDVTLQVPAGAAPGAYPNTTSSVVSTVLGVTSNRTAANDDLDVAGLTFSKDFIDDPVLPGGTMTLRFSIANVTPATDVTDIVFTDDLDFDLAGLTTAGGSVPQSDVCGLGSSLVLAGGNTLVFQGGNLLAGASCEFDVVLVVPNGAEDGTYLNTTSSILATVDGQTVAFGNAAATFDVVSEFLVLEKEFLDDPVAPGGTVTLQFTLTNTDQNNAITNITFNDDLDAALAGLTSISGTQLDVCGTGSQVTGSGVVTLSGGSLPAGGGCAFTVTVSVPLDVELGSVVTNTTSGVAGSIGSHPVIGPAASDDLSIDFVTFSKSFGGEATLGGTVGLTFTIVNFNATNAIGALSFSDDLSAVLPGLVSLSGTQTDVCGAGSEISGSSLLTFTSGSLLPGGSCTFGVTLSVPGSAAAGSYVNVTSDLDTNGLRVADATSAVLTVIADVDGDDDGVDDAVDACPNTVIPEGVPTERLGVNRFALVDGDGIFDTTPPNGKGPQASFTIEDTKGCSCEQIIDILGLGNGHTKFGCSLSAMRDFVALID